MSAKNYRTITGASESSAARDLAELVESGVLSRIGKARATRFSLVVPDTQTLLRGWTPNPLPRTQGRPLYR